MSGREANTASAQRDGPPIVLCFLSEKPTHHGGVLGSTALPELDDSAERSSGKTGHLSAIILRSCP